MEKNYEEIFLFKLPFQLKMFVFLLLFFRTNFIDLLFCSDFLRINLIKTEFRCVYAPSF